MEERELYWLAGLLEGEGSFLPGSPKQPRNPTITVASTDHDVIERVGTLFGNKVSPIGHKGSLGKKTMYSVRLSGRRAVVLMHGLRPLMGARRQGQIDRSSASIDLSVVPRSGSKNKATKLSDEQVLSIFRRYRAGEK